MQGDPNDATGGALVTPMGVIKATWSFGWAAIFLVCYNSKEMLGVQLFGGAVWLVLVGVRLLFLALSEGVFSMCGFGKYNPISRFFMHLERVLVIADDYGSGSMVGWKSMTQSFWQSLRMTRESKRVEGMLVRACVPLCSSTRHRPRPPRACSAVVHRVHLQARV